MENGRTDIMERFSSGYILKTLLTSKEMAEAEQNAMDLSTETQDEFTLSNDRIPTTRKMSMKGEGSLVEQNGVVQPLLTDLYQITMCYAYWKCGKENDEAVFDLFFRRNPFRGEFTVFAGLEECVKFLKNFRFSESDIVYLKRMLPPTTDPVFFTYLKNIDCKKVKLYAIQEGSVVFPKVPLIRVEGPLPIAQLLETTFLNLVNYASLVATNAARFRLAAGKDMKLLEFGLRRAQGPDGGLSASRYSYLGGFDGTSNVLAGKLFNIPVGGTHAHAFITSFVSLEEITVRDIQTPDGKKFNLFDSSQKWLKEVCSVLGVLREEVNMGELAAFLSYTIAFPTSVVCLLDTYDVMRSGTPNFCAVALALNDAGYKALGIRLDSGDLAYLSLQVRKAFKTIAEKFSLPWFTDLTIVASNDINEDTIHSLNQQGHSITCFGIGTHLVTCKSQPALGCVYKLVEINKTPRMKLSEDIEKVTLPGKKDAYRLFGEDGRALVDLLQQAKDAAPKANERVLCRHPFTESKRAYVSPSKVEKLHELYWSEGRVCHELPSISRLREHTRDCLAYLRQDHIRALNPTPYKVSVSASLYESVHDFWLQCAPIGELK